MTHELERQEPEVYTRMKLIEEVGLYHLKGYRNSEIQEVLGISNSDVKKYIVEYKGLLEKAAEDNPYFLEEVQFNTLRVMAELNDISKEIWESVELATQQGMVGARNQALKLALDSNAKKAQLLNLMGAGGGDAEYIARMQKAETVNQIISKVIRDVISDCDHCRNRARPMLREAFAMMNEEGFEDAQAAADHLDFENGDIVEDEEG
jgi:predicted transcriptional regulator/bacterioferritin-associated ferredoxin